MTALTQNFSGGYPVAGWSVVSGAAWTVDAPTAMFNLGSHVLRCPGTNQAFRCDTPFSPNVEMSADIWMPYANYGQQIFIRGTPNTLAANSLRLALSNGTGAAMSLWSTSGGIGGGPYGALPTGAFTNQSWYRVTLRAVGRVVLAKCQCLGAQPSGSGTLTPDGRWVAPDGTWQTNEVWAIRSPRVAGVPGSNNNGAFFGYTVTADTESNPGHSMVQSYAPWECYCGCLVGNVNHAVWDNISIADIDPPNIVVTDGNSLTGELPTSTQWQDAAMTLLGPDYLDFTFAVGGQGLQGMISRAAYVDAAFTAGKQNILVAWEVTNELSTSDDVAATLSYLRAYCLARKARGFKVIVATCLPKSGTGISAGFEANRQAANTAIRQQWWQYADALADVAGDYRIGIPNACFDPTWYRTDEASRVHMKQPGYDLVASIMASAIMNAVNSSRPLNVQPSGFSGGL